MAPTTLPVASSMAPIRHKGGPLPSSQWWGEPSTCSIIPSAAFLSRRLRCLFPRLFRGDAIPAPRRIRRTFSRLISSFSCSTSFSVKCRSLNPRYFPCANSTTRLTSFSLVLCLHGRPRFPCTTPFAPSLVTPALIRLHCRSLTPITTPASTTVSSPLNTLCDTTENKNQHVCHRVQRLSSKFQCFECGQHLNFKFLVMHIQRVKVLRRTTALGSTHSGQYRFDHLLAKDQQRRQRADAWSAHPVAPRFTDPLHKRLAPQLAQVITRFAIPIAHHRSCLLRLHSLGQICGSEALGLGCQCNDRLGHRAHPRLLQVHARRALRALHTRRGQGIQLLAVHKAQVCRRHHTQKCHHHHLQAFQHARQFLQPLPTTQLLDVVDDDLHPQHPIPFVIHFQGQLAEVQLEHRQVIHRAVDDFLQSP